MIEGRHEKSFYGFLALHALCAVLKGWREETPDVPIFFIKQYKVRISNIPPFISKISV
jgi:hypothetical protein